MKAATGEGVQPSPENEDCPKECEWQLTMLDGP